MKRRTRKRTLLMVLLLLTGGAIVNVAVAWGCAIQSRVTSLKGAVPTIADLSWWSANAPTDFEPTLKEVSRGTGFGRESVMTMHFYYPSAFRERYGWPLLAMERSAWFDMGGKPLGDHFEVMSRSSSVGELPKRIVPWGFVGNSVTYAAILWLFFAATGFVRRHIRARRGQCPVCAYPVGTSDVCTECGKKV